MYYNVIFIVSSFIYKVYVMLSKKDKNLIILFKSITNEQLQYVPAKIYKVKKPSKTLIKEQNLNKQFEQMVITK